jgi:hypothetical protein
MLDLLAYALAVAADLAAAWAGTKAVERWDGVDSEGRPDVQVQAQVMVPPPECRQSDDQSPSPAGGPAECRGQ